MVSPTLRQTLVPAISRFLGICLLFFAACCQAAPQDLAGDWFRAPEGWSWQGQGNLDAAGLVPVDGVARAGGTFWHQADIELAKSGRYVLDFRNTSIIGHFRHIVLDAQGKVLFDMRGGIRYADDAHFPLRHGREIELPAGRYRVLTELDAPFFLLQPSPYLDTLAHYRVAISPGNALTLVCLGMLLGLMIYYGVLAAVRWRQAEAMYAVFILGNFLFNGMALQVFPQLLGLHWIYLVSIPILISNCAYVLFVTSLLEIRPDTHPRLFYAGRVALAVLVGLILVAALLPNWSLEICRFGVAVFLTYGLTAGILRSREGNVSARFYLYAIAAFFVLGMVTITASSFDGVYTLHIEHLGLLSASIEMVLLSLVLAYQFGELYWEKENALANLERSIQMARTDALTGLPNRLALDISLAGLPAQGSLTFIDLDGLKFYNDTFGHERGDDLLRTFARQLSLQLAQDATTITTAYRLGGDEFAVTCANGDLNLVGNAIAATIANMRAEGFEFAGASFGSVHMHESPVRNQVKHMADERMYEDKWRRGARRRAANGGGP